MSLSTLSENMTAQASKALSLDEAVALFKEIADLPLAYERFQGGCFARAQLMCAYMKHKGLEPFKAWEIEDRYNTLKVERENGQEASWWYHVAAAVYVRFPNGKVAPLVIDPGLFDGPVTTHQWASTINGFASKVQIVSYMNAPDGVRGNYKPNIFVSSDEEMCIKSKDELKEYTSKKSDEPRRVIPSDVMHAHYPDKKIRSGASWRTEKISLPILQP